MNLKLLLSLCFIISVSAQEWRKVATQSNPGISGIFFSSENIGWAVGAEGLIYKTTDAGNSWSIKYDDVDSITYRRINFANDNVGYAGGKYGNVRRTTDGGETWHAQVLTGATGDVNAICTFSDNQVWILVNVSAGSKIFYTSDGGFIWQDIYTTSQTSSDMQIIEGKNGVVVGNSIADFHYTKDGLNWIKSDPAQLGVPTYTKSNINGVHMVNSSIGYAVGWGSLVGLQPSIYFKTTDGGVSWNYLLQSKENSTYQTMYGVFFKDTENGIAVGGGGGAGSVSARTTDGGLNWIPIDIPCGSDLKRISGSLNNLWVCGEDGVIFRSTDFGDTWELLTDIPGSYLYTMQRVSSLILIAGGFNSVFIKSTNNGQEWKGKYIRANKTALNIYDIYFVNENVGYAAHNYGMLTKTTDGGETWFEVMPHTTNSFLYNSGVYFVDENYGFVVGREASNIDAIHKTTDGGNSWELKTNIASANLKSVAFADKNNGIAVGEKLKAIFTTDGGETWNPSSFITLPPGTSTPNLAKVVFKDNINATASGDGLILNSSDAGATWNFAPVENLTENLTGLCFKNAQNGWAAGSKLVKPRSVGIYKTTDGGVTWINKVDSSIFLKPEFVNGPVGQPLIYGIATNDDHAIICGTSSSIYTNAPTIVSINNESTVPSSIELLQNYPNPFNPSTTISFNLSKGSDVIIKVYDLLGREVKTVMGEYRNAGSHQINLSADGLSSGSYFYELRTGSGSVSRKMMVLK